MDRTEMKARAARQERVAKVVWGTLFVVMGVLFTLHDMGRIDLAGINKRMEAEHRSLAADKAVDGDFKTRWSSAFRDPQWLTVDLQAVAHVRRIILSWEGAHATEYEMQISNDGAHWTTLANVTDGNGGRDEHDVDATGRYVRMAGAHRATPYGYSLYEMQVFDEAGNLVSQNKPATASSVEGFSPFAHWLTFWPLLLLAAGLPAVIAPKDEGNQLLGLVMTAAGGFLQAQRLGLISWGFREAASVTLIVVGLLILIQSVRGSTRTDQDGSGPAQGLS